MLAFQNKIQTYRRLKRTQSSIGQHKSCAHFRALFPVNRLTGIYDGKWKLSPLPGSVIGAGVSGSVEKWRWRQFNNSRHSSSNNQNRISRQFSFIVYHPLPVSGAVAWNLRDLPQIFVLVWCCPIKISVLINRFVFGSSSLRKQV